MKGSTKHQKDLTQMKITRPNSNRRRQRKKLKETKKMKKK